MSTIREPSDRLAPVRDEEPVVRLRGRQPIAVDTPLVSDELALAATQVHCGVTASLSAGRTCSASAVQPVDATVADAILDILEREGVKYMFGVPGRPLSALFEAMHKRKAIRLVLAKHEAGAAFMAAAYARVSRGLSVCCVTSGPGATNAVTGVASAYTESLPVLLLTGQVPTSVFGKGAMQESSVHGVDVVSLYRPITKFSAMLPHPERSPDVLRCAIRTALSGRRGPVHLSLPADIIPQPISYMPLRPQQYRSARDVHLDREAISHAADLLLHANRPCILAGHGAALANASGPLLALAHALQAPVATSPKGKGVFPENHPLALGVLGFGGQEATEKYIESENVDVLLVVGSSMNEFGTNAWTIAVNAGKTLIQIDVDPTAIGTNYPIDVAVVGDAAAALRELLARLPAGALRKPPRLCARAQRPLVAVDGRAAEPEQTEHALKPQRLIHELRNAMPDDAMLFVDNGSAILWGNYYFQVRRPDTYFVDLGLNAMGSAVAGVVGGVMAAPHRRAVALVGDGAFAMHGFEIHTAVEERLPIVWVVLNNAGYGMVRQGEKLRQAEDLGVSRFRVPLDVAAMAQGLGARGVRVQTAAEFRDALDEALASAEPWVIDAVIDANEMAPTLERRVKKSTRSTVQHTATSTESS